VQNARSSLGNLRGGRRGFSDGGNSGNFGLVKLRSNLWEPLGLDGSNFTHEFFGCKNDFMEDYPFRWILEANGVGVNCEFLIIEKRICKILARISI
jgi:hypothetical protein